MRVLISTAGSHGDVLPFVAIGREFAAREHEVILYANPFFRRYATDAGIAFVPISAVDQYSALFGEAADGDPTRAFKNVARHFAEICPAYYRAMKADVLPGQTITIGSSLLFAPRLLRETDGIRGATIHLAPATFRSNLSPARLVPRWIDSGTPTPVKHVAWWLLDKLFYDPHFTRPLNRLRAELGLPGLQRIFRSWIHEADCVIGMFPGWFGEPQADWPKDVVLAGFPLYDHGDHGNQMPLSPSLDQFIKAGPPPVAFSAGTATAAAHGFFKASIEACESAGRRAILLSHFPQQIPAALPQGVIHVDYAPFGALLPRLAAFVHHGGVGSTSQALRAGVPQLIRPAAYDQFDNSSRAVRLGVAQELLPKHYTASAVAGALEKLTRDNALRQRCQQVATRLADCNSIALAGDAITDRLGVDTSNRPLQTASRLSAGRL
ncbi:MAG: nucleotide disphospho-sugar-binding domain-containing protein [Sterolibacterium sp.]|jgi:UDP:flavonoid glycosyltransferase YjiC (YdhE family)